MHAHTNTTNRQAMAARRRMCSRRTPPGTGDADADPDNGRALHAAVRDSSAASHDPPCELWVSRSSIGFWNGLCKARSRVRAQPSRICEAPPLTPVVAVLLVRLSAAPAVTPTPPTTHADTSVYDDAPANGVLRQHLPGRPGGRAADGRKVRLWFSGEGHGFGEGPLRRWPIAAGVQVRPRTPARASTSSRRTASLL